MSGITYLDEIIDYKYRIITKLQNSQRIIELLSNQQGIDLNSELAQTIQNNHIHDYLFLDDSVQDARADIMVDVSLVKVPTSTIKDLEVYIQVTANRNFVDLSFKGIKGNRLDNLCRYIDYELRDDRDFGIGKLEMRRCEPESVPKNFAAKLITYKSPDFARG